MLTRDIRTISGAARLLGISRQAIYHGIRCGHYKAVEISGITYVVIPHALRYMQERSKWRRRHNARLNARRVAE